MKRLFALLLCFTIIFSALTSTLVFAEQNPDENGESPTENIQEEIDVHGDGSESDEDDAKFDFADYDGQSDFTIEDKEELLNKVELNPVITNYEPLDTLVSRILSQIITPDMSTFEKVCAVYSYLMTGTTYDFNNPTAAATANSIIKTHYYKSRYDYLTVYDAYGMLVEHKGVCNHFSAAFVVMTRSIGLNSYLATCTSSSVGVGGHYSAMTELDGKLYRFDPVMGVVTHNTDEIETSEFFCTPMVSTTSSEFSNLHEQVSHYGGFEIGDTPLRNLSTKPSGATKDDVHLTFGSYPQTQVTDPDLIARLEEQLDGVEMNVYPYSYGTGEVGSHTLGEFMSWADVTLDGEKYRAVRLDDYRPKYIYRSISAKNSQQYKTGYYEGNTYWFKFEPIEWRLTDGDNLLVSDMVLDSQPFNNALYIYEKGKTIHGHRCYAFRDPEHTIPANNWEVSYIREWLNEEFYNTAFTEEEQEMIFDTELGANYGAGNYFNYGSTTDKVFLLSKDDVSNSSYFLSNADSRVTDSTGYAQSQGATSSKRQDAYGYSSGWLLRSAGMHSECISVVINTGAVHNNVSAGAANTGIRPAIRANIEYLMNGELSTPSNITSTATATGQITVKSQIINGADGYKFYCYSGDSDVPFKTVQSGSPYLVLSDLTPGETYRFCCSAYRMTDNQFEESELSPQTETMCRVFVNAPENFAAEPVATGTIRISFEPVENAAEYRVYRFVDSDTMELCAATSDTSIDISGFVVNTNYFFQMTAVSDDGNESFLSKNIVSCTCESFPKRPTDVVIEPCATGKLRVSWDAVEGAASYRVYRYYNDRDLELLCTTEETEYIATDLNPGNQYFYKIEAISENGTDVSALSALKGGTCESIPPVPLGLAANAVGTGRIELTWQASEGAARYNIYRFYAGKDMEFIGTSDETSYMISGLTVGSSYSYRIEAVSEDGEDISSLTRIVTASCVSMPPVPANITATPSATGKIRLSWDSSEGAGSYNIYRYYSKKDPELVGSTAETTFDIDGLTAGLSYSFMLEAVSDDGEDVSSISPLVTVVPESIPSVPSNITASTVKTGRIRLTWDESEGADIYSIYRYYSNRDPELIGRTDGTSYDIDGLTAGLSYSYMLQAATADGADVSSMSPLITVTCGSIPAIPENCSAQPYATGKIKLTWDASEGAAGYNIYRYYNANRLDFMGSSDETSFIVTDLVPGSTCYFKIEAVSDDGTDVSALTPLIIGYCESIPPIPREVEATPYATDKLLISWEACEGAGSYNVYRYYRTGETELLGSSATNSFIADDLTPGASYSFKVEAVSEDGKDVSGLSSPVSGTCTSIPAAPINVIAQAADRPFTVSLKWDAVDGATGYEVYRYSKTEGYVLLGETVTESFEAEGMKGGIQTAFCVKALKDADTFIHRSVYSGYAYGSANKMSAPSALNAAVTEACEITLSWSPCTGADRYDVYSYDLENKVYNYIDSSEDTECVLSGLTAETVYVFRVEAVAVFGENEYRSDKSPSATIKAIGGPPAPQNLIAEVSGTSVKLSWNSVKGAKKYAIYRKSDSPDDQDAFLGETDKTEFTVEQLPGNIMHVLYVRSVGASGDTALTGSPSASIPIIIPATVTYLLGDADGNGDVDMVDATFIQRLATNLTVNIDIETLMQGDVDGDGDLTVVDATFIQRYATHIKTPFKIGEPVTKN